MTQCTYAYETNPLGGAGVGEGDSKWCRRRHSWAHQQLVLLSDACDETPDRIPSDTLHARQAPSEARNAEEQRH